MNEIILMKSTKEYEKQMIEYKEEHIKNKEYITEDGENVQIYWIEL